MANLSLDAWSVADLRRSLAEPPTDATVLIGWADGQHFIGYVEERDGRVVLGADPSGPISH